MTGVLNDLNLELESVKREEMWLRREETGLVLDTLMKFMNQVCELLQHHHTVAPLSSSRAPPSSSAQRAYTPAIKMSVDDILAAARRSSPKLPLDASSRHHKLHQHSSASSSAQNGSAQEMVSFKTPTGSFGGFVVTRGALIVDAEIKLTPKAAGKPLSVTVNTINPWHLTQVQNAANLAQSVTQMIPVILNHAVDDDYALNLLEEDLRSLLRTLKQAHNHLMLPHPGSFFVKLAEPHVFNPTLPDDVEIEFVVENAVIICRAYLLKVFSDKQKPSPALSTQQAKGKGVAKPGDLFSRGNKVVEIVEVLLAPVPVTRLATAVTLLATSYNLISELYKKFNAIRFAIVGLSHI